ncbi:MAG: acryloyl-CoA reductase [Bacteroidetes bacterium]|nr:acryloyl-CoA reductase [Bacteroidota bacterium]
MFKSLVLTAPGQCSVEQFDELTYDQRPIEVSVEYSGINYKDALAVTGRGKIVRAPFPFVPGIDLAGTIIKSESTNFQSGDRVVLTGGGLGESFDGGFSQRQRVSSEYLMKLPDGMSTRQSMILGTAGMTAMLSVKALEEHHIREGKVLVTGASGGVGMIAIKLLASLGYSVIASCQSSHLRQKIMGLGAMETIDRIEPSRPLDHGIYEGVIDTVGGATLSGALSQVKRHGCVAASGNVGGAELLTTVYPFILRGVTLVGIDSNTAQRSDRIIAWKRLQDLIPPQEINQLFMGTVSIEDIERVCHAKVDGDAPGRFLVDLSSSEERCPQ